MKTKVFTGFLALIAFVVSACSVDPGINVSKNVKAYSANSLFNRGDFVEQNGRVYEAKTKVRGADPANHIADKKNPLYPWAKSSHQAAEEVANQEGLASSVRSVTIPQWKAGVIYYASDVVQSGGAYYKSFWWNTDQDPALAENRNGNPNWGPWVSITKEEAERLLGNTGGNTGGSTGGETGNTNTDGSTGGETGGGTTATNDGTTTPPPTTVDPDLAQQYQWSVTAVYLENGVAIFNGYYWRAKWWTQGNEPILNPANSWDTPWEIVDEETFLAFVNGTPPPVTQPPTGGGDNAGGGNTGGGNTGGGNTGGGITTPVEDAYKFVVENGYIQSWLNAPNNDAVPANIKANFSKVTAGTDGAYYFMVNDPQGPRLTADKWNSLFPRRFGSATWDELNFRNGDDYYSFDNFVDALKIMGKYVVFIETALDPNTQKKTSFEKVYVYNKVSKELRLINQSSDFFAPDHSWLANRPYQVDVVDYNNFGTEGSKNDKVRSVAGFLAHASHETSGSWATAPDFAFNKNLFSGATFPAYITDRLPGELAWSLYFNEEVAYSGATSSHYQDNYNKVYPPVPGQSYHGRGAFQLSWNYNYGLASAIFFGTSRVLLDQPNMILAGGSAPNTWISGQVKGGTLAFLTSLMFWMTPQGAKPSQQDTMVLNRNDGLYVAGTAKLTTAPGLGSPGYGWTINIMNGGYEANKSWEVGRPNYDAKVARRVKHYLFFTQAFGGNNQSEILDTYGNHSY